MSLTTFLDDSILIVELAGQHPFPRWPSFLPVLDLVFRARCNLKKRIHDIVPDHVTFLNQVTYLGNLVQTELPIERKPNQITFG